MDTALAADELISVARLSSHLCEHTGTHFESPNEARPRAGATSVGANASRVDATPAGFNLER